MADRVDAAMNAVKLPGIEATGQGAVVESGGRQLRRRDDPMLVGRNSRDQMPRWVDFRSHTERKATQAADFAPSV